jgi:hypothetical protein
MDLTRENMASGSIQKVPITGRSPGKVGLRSIFDDFAMFAVRMPEINQVALQQLSQADCQGIELCVLSDVN